MAKPDFKKVEAERNRLNAILGAAKTRETVAANRKMIGKCFVYMDTYGACDDMKRWPLYISINRMERYGGLVGLKFEMTSRNHIEIDTSYSCHHVNPGNDYREITRAEFDKALNTLKAAVKKL